MEDKTILTKEQIYEEIKISVTTHSENAVTKADIDFAKKLEYLFK